MKLPVKIVDRRGQFGDVQIADASGRIVATVVNCAEDRKVARLIVSRLNRWRWFRSCYEYTRDDWLWEQNKWRPN